ncbi:MAG TPA: hypothetical protein VHV83_09320, partial [Armatimonadota bacterium]|nr:hypothetical protein [Armatimonadota bacterium]
MSAPSLSRFVNCSPMLLALGLLTLSTQPVFAAPNTGSPLGINVTDINDFTPEVVFTDFIKQMRGWEDSRTGDAFPQSQLDSCGWVKSLLTGQEAWLGYGAGTEGHFPTGTYTCLYDGSGTIEGRMGATVINRQPGKITFDVKNTDPWFGLRITATDPQNYIRNIRFILPGFANTYQSQLFHPQYLEHLSKFRILRFMDIGHANGSKVKEWSDIKKGNWFTQCSSDYRYEQSSPELMIRLCNTLGADGWFCMPFQASDSCITRYAQLIRDSLRSDCKAYIEYSNEVWNWGFEQAGYAKEQGMRLGLPGNDGNVTQGSAEYYAYRSAQIWRIFETVFSGQTNRIVKVLGGQAAWSGLFDEMFRILDDAKYNPGNTRPDVLAVAPYFGFELGNGDMHGLSADQLMDRIFSEALPQASQWIKECSSMARAHNCRLVAYEGGQHLYPGTDTMKLRLFTECNRSPRMKTAYLQYLKDWFAQGGDVFVHYSSCGL